MTQACEPGRLDAGLERGDVEMAPDERLGDVVDAELEREVEVGEILLRQRGNRQRNARHVHALVRLDDPAGHDRGRARGRPSRRSTAQTHVAVVDEDLVADLEDRRRGRRAPPVGRRRRTPPARRRRPRRRRRAFAVRRARRSGSSGPGGRRSARAAGRPPPARRVRGARSARDRRASRARSSAEGRPCPTSTSAASGVEVARRRADGGDDLRAAIRLEHSGRLVPCGRRPSPGTSRHRRAPPRSGAAGCTSRRDRCARERRS